MGSTLNLPFPYSAPFHPLGQKKKKEKRPRPDRGCSGHASPPPHPQGSVPGKGLLTVGARHTLHLAPQPFPSHFLPPRLLDGPHAHVPGLPECRIADQGPHPQLRTLDPQEQVSAEPAPHEGFPLPYR